MKKRHLAFLLVALLISVSAVAQIGVGEWRTHFSYNRIFHVQTVGNYVYAAASQGLLRYNRAAGKVDYLNKTTGLTDVGVSTMAYDKSTATLVVAYTNSNIDLVQEGEVQNVSGIYRSNIVGDKSIHSIRFHDGNAYLACAFGIVVVDLKRAEIKETYYLDVSGRCNVNDVAFTDSLICAATEGGLKCASLSAGNLAIVNKWKTDSTSLLSGQDILHLEVMNKRLLALVKDSVSGEYTLYKQQQEGNFAPWRSGVIKNLRMHNDTLLVCTDDSILVFDNTWQQISDATAHDWMDMNVHDADIDEGVMWIAHDWAGVVWYDVSNDKIGSVTPTGPWSADVYRVVPSQDKTILCRGGKFTTYTAAGISADINTFSDEAWSGLQGGNGLDTLSDVLDVAVNPKNSKEWLACSWGHGIMQIVDGQLVNVYNEGNTDGALTAYRAGNYRSLRTAAVTFDAGGNAWMTNSLVSNGIVTRLSDGTWKSYDVSSMVSGSEIDKILFDSIRGYIWFAGRANRIYIFHTENDEVQLAYVNPNNGSKVETSSVNCMVQDHDGDIWVGTNKGIKKIFDGYKAFLNGGNGEQSSVSCSNILISNGDIAEYLMAYENVTCMAVDGANRKWVGTAEGGLYLLSASGLVQLEHFTADNSPLLSNKIITIAVNPISGEVFIGTDEGLQSYRGTAVYATGKNSEDIHAFPNPVRPDYDGPIAIKGFSRNAIVHITDAAGHGIFSTTANGGQAIWNGRTNEGKKVASGVYFVFASDANSKTRAVTKILVIR